MVSGVLTWRDAKGGSVIIARRHLFIVSLIIFIEFGESGECEKPPTGVLVLWSWR